MSPEARTRLTALFNAGQIPTFMTGQEGQELVQAGLIVANPSEVDPSNPLAVRVQITEAGVAALQSAPPVAPTAPAAAPSFQIATTVGIPKVKRGGNTGNLTKRESQYPFDQLPEPTVNENGEPVYASFHVPVTEKSPEPWKKMASNVSAANRRFEEVEKDENGQPVMETVEKKTLLKGADKKPMLDSEGNKQYQVSQVSQPKSKLTRKFIARRVNKDDPNGEGVRIFRVPLDF